MPRPGVGPRPRIPSSCTSTGCPRVVTSPRGNSRPRSHRRCAPRSARCADDRGAPRSSASETRRFGRGGSPAPNVSVRPKCETLTMVASPARAGAEEAGLERFELDDIVGYRRSPSDVLRLIIFGTVTVVLLVLTRWAEGTVLALEGDVVALFGGR